MGLTVSDSGGGNFKMVPAGVHMARCYRVVDLGTQITNWQGEEKLTPQLAIYWELHGEDADGQPLNADNGEPLTLFATYTKSLGAKSKLRGVLESWRGRPFTEADLKGFDVSKLLGAFCMVNVTHSTGGNGKTYANVASITPLPSALQKSKPAGVLPAVLFDLDDFDEEVFMSFHEKLREKIDQSVERKSGPKKKSEAKPVSEDFEDIPF